MEFCLINFLLNYENVFKSKYSKESTFIESKNFPNDSYANVNIRIIVGGILGFFSVYNRDTYPCPDQTLRELYLCISFGSACWGPTFGMGTESGRWRMGIRKGLVCRVALRLAFELMY